MNCTYYIDNQLEEADRRKLQKSKALDLYASGILNLKTKLPGEGIVNASVATPDLCYDADDLQRLSIESSYPVYLVPEKSGLLFDDDGYFISAIGQKAGDIWQYIEGWPMPQPCFSNGFPFAFDMEQMWKSDTAIESIPVSDLEWNLDYPWWEDEDGEKYRLKPREALNEINRYPSHKSRIEHADTEHPLILGMTLQKRWLILDGMHRFVKMILNRHTEVQVKKFSLGRLRAFVSTEDHDRFDRWRNSRL